MWEHPVSIKTLESITKGDRKERKNEISFHFHFIFFIQGKVYSLFTCCHAKFRTERKIERGRYYGLLRVD